MFRIRVLGIRVRIGVEVRVEALNLRDEVVNDGASDA